MPSQSYPYWLVPFLIISVILLAFTSVVSTNVISARDVENGLSATGEYSAFLEPDEATFYIRVDTVAETANDASAENAALSKHVIDSLKSAGLIDEEIDTSSYNVYKKEFYPEMRNNGTDEYMATHSIRVRTDETTRVGEYIDVAMQNGATGVDSVSFSLSDAKKNEAYENAFKAASDIAREKAHAKADSLGVKLGKLIDISETSDGAYPWFASAEYDKRQTSIEINPQQQEYRISVTLTYAIRG